MYAWQRGQPLVAQRRKTVEVPRDDIEAMSWQLLPAAGRIWVYIPVKADNEPGVGLPVASAEFPVLESYIDVVVEGDASTVNDQPELERVAAAYEGKYGAQFTAPEGTWFGLADAIRGNTVLVFRVPPARDN